MTSLLHTLIAAILSGYAPNHLEDFGDLETRHRRNLIHYTCLSLAVVIAFLVPLYFLLRDVFPLALIYSLGVVVPLLLATLALAHYRRRAAEYALLAAFCAAAVLSFDLLRSSRAEASLRAFLEVTICCLQFIWCGATFGARRWKPAVIYVVICTTAWATFGRLPGLPWSVVLTLDLLTLTYAVMATLSQVFTQWDERGFVSEGQRLLSAIGAGQHDLWSLDISSGQADIVRVLPAGGRQRSTLTVAKCLSRIHPEDRRHVREYVRSCLRQSKSMAPCQYRWAAEPGGEYCWHEGIAKVVEFDRNGRPVTLLGMSNDINDQERLTRQLQRQSEDIARATRIKSDVLATMSHEVRTPLSGILGMASLLADADLSDRQRSLVSIIQNSGAALLQTLNDVLDFSRIEAGKLSLDRAPFEVASIARHCLNCVADAAQEKSLAMRLSLGSDVSSWVAGDALRLSQILIHLLSNAVNFADAGEIVLEVSSAGPATDGFQVLRFAVCDDGIGMDEEAQGRLFSPFTPVHGKGFTAGTGVGLGLALSRHLAEAMGGTIACDSAPCKGTRMTVELKLAVCPALTISERDSLLRARSFRPAVAARQRSDTIPANGLRVLVAEDNPVNQVVIERMLRRLGYHPRVVGNGMEAVEAVKDGGYDLILMDCEMPVLGGLESAQRIRQLPGFEMLPIIALSAHSAEQHAALCSGAGMSDYLPKPVTLQALHEKLEQWL